MLLGLYTLENPSNQQRLKWGGSDANLLSLLSSLPFKYFCEDRLKEQLFPTLISATAFNDDNRTAICNYINPELLAGFLGIKMENEESDKAILLSQRVPMDSWSGLKNYYE